jgi:endonuclease/exonuclease/phosphatase family metal-dependent hydrolase
MHTRRGAERDGHDVRIVTYNVHSCVGTDALLSPERVAAVIAETAPDVVCLQELDAGRARTRRLRQAEVIAQELGMACEFHPAIRLEREQYGDAILSREPLRVVRAEILPWPKSLLAFEPRGALWISTTIAGTEWQIINTHLGLGRAERRIQAEALAAAEWIGSAVKRPPLVVCGDFNSRPASKVHRILAREVVDAQTLVPGRRENTFATRLPLICLDYVFVSRDVEVRELRAIKSPLARLASDHFPLFAELERKPAHADI